MPQKEKKEYISNDIVDYVTYLSGNDTVIVWFGGIDEPFMSENFANSQDKDIVLLRDCGNDWYSTGVLPEHSSIEEGVEFLDTILADYKKKIFCGQSSGGYAALLYSWHCDADLCIPFAPQTSNMFSGQCTMIPHVPIVDVAKLHLDTPRPHIVINVSRSEVEHEDEFFWDDWRHIKRLAASPYVTIIDHPYHAHAVTVRLHQDSRLYLLVRNLINIYA